MHAGAWNPGRLVAILPGGGGGGGGGEALPSLTQQ